MAFRYHMYFIAMDESGKSLSDTDINIYLANSTTPAKIWSAEIAGTFINTIPQRVTDATTGFFEFWVDSTDYSSNQKFKIEYIKDNTSINTIDYIPLSGYVNHNEIFGAQGDNLSELFHITLEQKTWIANKSNIKTFFLGT